MGSIHRLGVGQEYSWVFHARVVYSQPGALIPCLWHPTVTHPVTVENRLVRQPRIIGHTSRDHHIHEYHYKQAHRCYKWFIWPSRQDNASCPTWLYKECLMAAEDISKATARSGSTPQVLAGLLILALLTPTPRYGRRWSSLKTWHKTPAPKRVSTLNVLAR